MSVAGYVLAGGNSTRMGRDKALLRSNGLALVQQTAASVGRAVGNVTLIGDPAKYGAFGYVAVPDLRPGCGPLAGMETALLHSRSEWNLMVACDLASIGVNFLQTLCAEALELPPDVDCLIPAGPDGRPQPLSAVYRIRCLSAFSAALDRDLRKVTEVLKSLETRLRPTDESQMFQNVNTPEDWNRYVNGRINDEQPAR